MLNPTGECKRTFGIFQSEANTQRCGGKGGVNKGVHERWCGEGGKSSFQRGCMWRRAMKEREKW